MVEGIIKFIGFKVEKIIYERKVITADSENNTISPDFMIFLVEKESSHQDTNLFNILFGVRIGFNDKDTIPFLTEVVIRGYYQFNRESAGDSELGDKQKMFLTNGCAILYPYLRSILTDVTSKSHHNPVLLPTINFHKFIDSKDIKELLLDPSQYVNFT